MNSRGVVECKTSTWCYSSVGKKQNKNKTIYIYIYIYMDLFRESKCMIWMLKGNLNFIKNCEINWAGFFTTKTRTPGLCLNCFWDGEKYIVVRSNSVTCAILSIPTEARFTNALERSLRTFTSCIIIATIAGNFGIFFDVWSTQWQ